MTEHDTANFELTAQQMMAVDRLALGDTMTDAAAAAGVARQTVSEWYNHHFRFKAAVNLRRQEIWESSADRLRALVPKALSIIESELDQGRVPAAVHVLKAAGVYGNPAKIGSTDSLDLALDDQSRERDRLDRKMFGN